MAKVWLKSVPGGVELSVLVQPRASKSKVVGEHGDQLKLALAAPPVDGEANAELTDFLARHFQVPKRQVELVAGDSSRRKRVRIQGATWEQAEALLPGSR